MTRRVCVLWLGLVLLSLFYSAAENGSFKPSREVPVQTLLPNEEWEWRFERFRSRPLCGFTLDPVTNAEKIQFSPNCRVQATVPLKTFHKHESLFKTLNRTPYEKQFIYFNIRLHFEAGWGMSSVDDALISTLRQSLRATPLFIDISMSTSIHHEYLPLLPLAEATGTNAIALQYSNIVAWMMNGQSPEDHEATHLLVSITDVDRSLGIDKAEHSSSETINEQLHESRQLNTSWTPFSFSSAASNGSHDRLLPEWASRLQIHLTSATLSVVTQPSRVPLNYTIAAIDALETQYRPNAMNDASGSQMMQYSSFMCRLSVSNHSFPLRRMKIESPIDSMTANGIVSVPRIFCGIFSTAEHHSTRIKAIRETWARKCSFFLVFSTKDDLSIPAIAFPHFGQEQYKNMWQKSRSIWKYIHEFYRQDFDWFLLGGDDMFYVMENLVGLLMSPPVQQRHRSASSTGVYLGRRLRLPELLYNQSTIYFNSGGPGYLLDTRAVENLVFYLDDERCHPYGLFSHEDAFVAICLLSTVGLVPFPDTADDQGRPRFHPLSPADTYILPERGSWLEKYADNPLRNGTDCCSPSSVAFHYITPTLMRDIYDYLYLCER